jgi:hypothetical protein
LRNKGNRFYQNTHGVIFRTKTNDKKEKKKIALMKKSRDLRAKLKLSAEGYSTRQMALARAITKE